MESVAGLPPVQRGRRYCYIHKGNAKRGVDTEQIVRTKGFDAPVRVKRDGTYKIKGGRPYISAYPATFCWRMPACGGRNAGP